MESKRAESGPLGLGKGGDDKPWSWVLKGVAEMRSWEELDSCLGTGVPPTLVDLQIEVPTNSYDRSFETSLEAHASQFVVSDTPCEPLSVRKGAMPAEITFQDLETAAAAAGWKPYVIPQFTVPDLDDALGTQFHGPLPCALYTADNITEIGKRGRFDLVLAAVRSGFGLVYDDKITDRFDVHNFLNVDFPAAFEVLATSVIPSAMRRIQIKNITWEEIAYGFTSVGVDQAYVSAIEACGVEIMNRPSWMMDVKNVESPR